MPSAVFAAFASRLQTLFPDGEHSVLPSSSNRGGQFTWSLRAVLQDNPSSLDTDELDDNSEGQS
jgi:hypothetical protein